MDYRADHWINQLMQHHPLMAQVVIQFSTWSVTLFGVLAAGLWLLSPPGDIRWKRATAAGLGSAALGLGINQVVSHLWARPRPYDAHHVIVPLLTRSADPSFPSDHATAAFSIAFGIFFVSRRAGWSFLGFATLIAASRVLAGMHYPTDVIASFFVSIASAFIVARLLMRPIMLPLIRLVSRFTDPLLGTLAQLRLIDRTVLNPRFRAGAVALLTLLVLARIAYAERSHLIDELPLAVIATWAGIAALAIRLANSPFWPSADRRHPTRRLSNG